MAKENSIKHEEFVKLKVKATSLKKELTNLNNQNIEAGADDDGDDDQENEGQKIEEITPDVKDDKEEDVEHNHM